MHKSSYLRMEFLVKYYERFYSKDKEHVNVLDIGSYDMNGTYKNLFAEKTYSYTGLDMSAGPNVDVVPNDIYDWKEEFEDASFDLVISGQVFEHVEYPWRTMEEICRVLKPSGFCIIIAPNAGVEHKAPKDCYRYFADGLAALAKWAGLKVHHVSVAGVPDKDAFTDEWLSAWNDCCLVAQKSPIEEVEIPSPFNHEERMPASRK